MGSVHVDQSSRASVPRYTALLGEHQHMARTGPDAPIPEGPFLLYLLAMYRWPQALNRNIKPADAVTASVRIRTTWRPGMNLIHEQSTTQCQDPGWHWRMPERYYFLSSSP